MVWEVLGKERAKAIDTNYTKLKLYYSHNPRKLTLLLACNNSCKQVTKITLNFFRIELTKIFIIIQTTYKCTYVHTILAN